VISQTDALSALAPHCSGLYKIATAPWDEYHARMPEDLLVTFTARTRASSIHDLMVREATRYAAENQDVRPFERQMMRGIVIGGTIAIRFKKLDEESHSKGHYTKQVAEYRNQRQLDGIDAVHHLELGYVLNQFETEVEEVRLVCPSGHGTAWWSRIDRGSIEPAVIDLLPVDNGPRSTGGAIIKPKTGGIVVPIRRIGDEDQR
jgi:hypothetical protein